MSLRKPASPTKVALFFVAALSLAHPVSAQEDEEQVVTRTTALNPAAMALATQIVDIAYPEDKREELFFRTMDQTVAQLRQSLTPMLPEDNPSAVKILDDWIIEYTQESKVVLRKHIPTIMQGMAQSYVNIFTLDELRDILAFVQTPSGKRYFELSPGISSDKAFADANQSYYDETMAMLLPAQRELMDRLEKHLNDQKADNSVPDT